MPGGYKRGWEPLVKMDFRDIKPFYRELHEKGDCDVEVWLSARYEVTVRASRTEPVKHLSVNLRDRSPMRNWRHLQQAKNEVCGELWTGIEIFPAEDHLTDTANQYHLFCFPPGYKVGAMKEHEKGIETVPIGLGDHPMVSDDEEVERWNAQPHKGRQEPWEDGLTTGRTEHSSAARKLLTETNAEVFPN
jgi:hypothetical protein